MADNTLSEIESFLKDVGTRAVKTAVQAGGAAVATSFAASSIDFGHLTSVPVDARLIGSAVIAGVGAGFSAGWNLIKGYFSARKLRKAALDALEAAAHDLVPMSAGAPDPVATEPVGESK